MDAYPCLMEGGNVMQRLFGTTLCSVLLAATSLVWAQPPPPPPAPQTQHTAQGTVEFMEHQQQSDWVTSALIGRTVTNAQGESLGDINDIIIDEQGHVVAVIIGVGGFLGIGEKDVGVRYTALHFEPLPEPPRAPPPGAAPGQQPGTAPAPQAPRQDDPKHRDKLIVLDVSKEQLEAAPPYRKLGEK
jgi:hypothetical protein